MSSDFYSQSSFLCKDGSAKKAGRDYSKLKVCLACTDVDFLKRLLSLTAEDNDCYWVKLSSKSRDGMFLGRCFFTSSDAAGKFWAKYKNHPRLIVSLQDDEVVSVFRDLVKSWKDKPADSLEWK